MSLYLTGTSGRGKLDKNKILTKEDDRGSTCYMYDFNEEQLSSIKKVEDSNKYSKFVRYAF